MNPVEIFHYREPFRLESGIELPGYHLAYQTWGTLNQERNNVVWIFHALTGNSNPADWWPGLVGEGKLFNPQKYFLICVNMPGSCYGSIGPLSVNPATGQPWWHDFPVFTTRDMIRAYQPLRKALGIEKIFIGIGGSMGGQQLLEWAIEEPALFENIIPIATNAVHSPWGIAFNSSQRMAIEADVTWKEKHALAGIEGMKVARSVALLSYRHYESYEKTQTDTATDKLSSFKAESYQRYQGEKLAKRFNAFSYYMLTQSMDAHNVGRGRSSVAEALESIEANALVISITTDILFPVAEQEFIAHHIPDAAFHAIYSPYGHDGFLLEFDAIEKIVRQFLSKRSYFYQNLISQI